MRKVLLPAFSRRRLALLATAALMLAAAAPRDDAAAARARLVECEQARSASLEALELAYARIEGAWEDWRRTEPDRATTLGEEFGLAYAAKQAEFAARRAGSRDAREARAQKRGEADELAAAFREVLDRRGIHEPTLRDTFATAALRDVAGRSADDVPAHVEALAARWLGRAQRFELLWNELLHRHCQEVKAWRERSDECVAAGVELDRVLHPETFLPGGARARPGMVYIAGGTYTVGPNLGIERKKRRVTVRPFMLDRCEVTNRDYQAFLAALPAEQRAARTPRHWTADAGGQAAPPPELLDHPVTMITWRDADAFARAQGKRLPTEDEWEVAARGREAFAYPWGADWLAGRANDAKADRGATLPAQALEDGASPFKVLQMSGNVEEWTASSEDGDTLTELPSNIAAVVVRGGHFRSPPEYASALFRWVAPGGSTREPHLGFRCAADLK
ncbi:MAG: formylglycine-generating enzyme family protein [Planctomycetes bacterium]|nr:formylglycine-generating enzyme family protein [Planctomycetota bacterium]